MEEDIPIFEKLLKNGRSASLFNFKNESTQSEFKPIDLNNENNLLELEDPILIMHMSNSRKKLEEYKKEYEKLSKSKEALDSEILENSKLSTTYMMKLKNTTNTLSLNTEQLVLQNSNLEKLYKGNIPYGFPDINFSKMDSPSFKKVVNHLNDKMCILFLLSFPFYLLQFWIYLEL
jgi:hypothetical protein